MPTAVSQAFYESMDADCWDNCPTYMFAVEPGTASKLPGIIHHNH